jgi:exodeoxyribonuclease V alpha subunit
MGQQADAKTEVLAGLVERVTFHNPENGFCVLRLKAIAIWSQRWAMPR